MALEAETWGDQLRRARERSRLRLRELARMISPFEPTSHQRLLNLEELTEPPIDASRRILALLAVVAYGYDPAVFGLSWDDLPRRIDQADVIEALAAPQRMVKMNWAPMTWEATGQLLDLAEAA
jgi:hypothetical protein